MIRLFVPQSLTDGLHIEPSEEQCRYLIAVMRLQLGDELLLFNGQDGEWLFRMSGVSKRGCRLTAISQTRPQTLGPDLDLLIALVKRGPLETIMEKATELGVRRIRLVVTRRTQADHTNVSRLRAIATEAAEQTGRLDVPEIAEPAKLEQILADWSGARRLMFCDEAGDDPTAEWGGEQGRAQPVLQALWGKTPAPWAVLIGPEGGFAPEERQQLRGMTGVTPVTLGPRILRADTAAISALTLWQAALGDWRQSS
jgi:16S rRNA (uracil1498-N3)-methyltransferase